MATAKLDIAHGAASHSWIDSLTSLFSFSASRRDAELRDAVDALHGMSDRELKDIGIGRSEIYSAVHGVK
jgi:uncharacterized protein YjiS (DUF1127 family)